MGGGGFPCPQQGESWGPGEERGKYFHNLRKSYAADGLSPATQHILCTDEVHWCYRDTGQLCCHAQGEVASRQPAPESTLDRSGLTDRPTIQSPKRPSPLGPRSRSTTSNKKPGPRHRHTIASGLHIGTCPVRLTWFKKRTTSLGSREPSERPAHAEARHHPRPELLVFLYRHVFLTGLERDIESSNVERLGQVLHIDEEP